MALDETIDRIRDEILLAQNRGELATLSEADARREFVDPILQELGWTGVSRLRREYSVKGQKRMKVDYALLGADGKPVALIEAKSPREDLSKHVDQLFSYASRQKVNICALTTGVEWWLYLPSAGGEPMERRFAVLDFGARWDHGLAKGLREVIGYDALATGVATVRAQELLKDRIEFRRVLREIPRAWDRLLAYPSNLLTQAIQEEVELATGLTPAPGRIWYHLMKVFFETESVSETTMKEYYDSVTWQEILRVVEGVSGLELPPKLPAVDPHEERAKHLAVYIARRHSKTPYTEMAEYLDLTSHSSLVDVFRSVETQLADTTGDDPWVEETQWLYREIVDRLPK